MRQSFICEVCGMIFPTANECEKHEAIHKSRLEPIEIYPTWQIPDAQHSFTCETYPDLIKVSFQDNTTRCYNKTQY